MRRPSPHRVSPAGQQADQTPETAQKTRKETPARDNLVEFGTTEVPRAQSKIHTLVIIGQIEGHIVLPSQNKTTKYEHVIPQLVAIEENPDIEGLLIIMNTVGGDVEAGLALAEMVAGLSKPTVSLVLGGGHSIGAPVAVAAAYTFITPTATMTIHPIRMNGLVIGVPQTYEYLDKMQDRVVDFVVNHAAITEAKFRELMFRTGELARDIGTVLVGRDAVACGLINAVGGVEDALDTLHDMIRQQKKLQTAWKRRRRSVARTSSKLGSPDALGVSASKSTRPRRRRAKPGPLPDISP